MWLIHEHSSTHDQYVTKLVESLKGVWVDVDFGYTCRLYIRALS